MSALYARVRIPTFLRVYLYTYIIQAYAASHILSSTQVAQGLAYLSLAHASDFGDGFANRSSADVEIHALVCRRNFPRRQVDGCQRALRTEPQNASKHVAHRRAQLVPPLFIVDR